MYVKTPFANKVCFSNPIQSPIKNDTKKIFLIFSKSRGIRQLVSEFANWQNMAPPAGAQPLTAPARGRSPGHPYSHIAPTAPHCPRL